MSERTFESRFARSRASEMLDERRFSSRRCSASTSRWRARLFCLRAEEVRVASESRRRVSWPIKASRFWTLDVYARSDSCDGGVVTFSRRLWIWPSTRCSSSDGFGGNCDIDAY